MSQIPDHVAWLYEDEEPKKVVTPREEWFVRWPLTESGEARNLRNCLKGSHPDLPFDMIPEGWEPGCEELEKLWSEVLLELLDADYRNRTHGSRRTYESGCTGPLCKKATREHSRRRHAQGPSERYKYVDPILEFFKEDALEQISLWEDHIKKSLSTLL